MTFKKNLNIGEIRYQMLYGFILTRAALCITLYLDTLNVKQLNTCFSVLINNVCKSPDSVILFVEVILRQIEELGYCHFTSFEVILTVKDTFCLRQQLLAHKSNLRHINCGKFLREKLFMCMC